jgi:ABC-type Fe3+ transport system permease subunit
MGKSQAKRRSTRTHQSVKTAGARKKKINWVQIAAIIIGVVIVISMILSMIMVPGASSPGF